MGNTDKFEMIADQYDTPERVQIAKLSSDAVRAYLVDTKGKSAMDFGCGTGLIGLDLIGDFASMLFVDTSLKMIHRVEKKIANAKIPNATTLCFDMEKDSLLGLNVDYICMAQVLLHIGDVELILSRLYDVLHQGGHLLIVDFDQNDKVISELVHPGFDQTELSNTMRKLGYQDIGTRTFYTGSKIFMGQDASMFVLDARK